MKIKQLSISLASILLVLFCSCGAPVESETETDTKPVEAEADAATAKNLEEITNSFLPDLITQEIDNWQDKVKIDNLSDELYQIDKPLVCLCFSDFSDETVAEYAEQLKRWKSFENKNSLLYSARNRLRYALALKIRDHYIKDWADFVSYAWMGDGIVFVYASAEDIEYYAKCNVVTEIKTMSEVEYSMLIDTSFRKSRHYGANLYGWQTTLSIRQGAQMVQRPITYRLYNAAFPHFEEWEYLNVDRMDILGAGATPIIRIDSVDQLPSTSSITNSRIAQNWNELFANYNDAFFETKSLLVLSFKVDSLMAIRSMSMAVVDETFYITATQYNPTGGNISNDLRSSVSIILEVEKSAIADCTTFDAWKR